MEEGLGQVIKYRATDKPDVIKRGINGFFFIFPAKPPRAKELFSSEFRNPGKEKPYKIRIWRTNSTNVDPCRGTANQEPPAVKFAWPVLNVRVGK